MDPPFSLIKPPKRPLTSLEQLFGESLFESDSDRSPPAKLIRRHSDNYKTQDGGTCFIHVIANVLTRLVENILDERNLDSEIMDENTDSERIVIPENTLYEEDICNILFNTRETPDILKTIVELKGQCNERTFIKALLHRMIYKIIYDASYKIDGQPLGAFHAIQYVFDYCETITKKEIDFWETEDVECKSYVNIAFLSLALIYDAWKTNLVVIDIIKDDFDSEPEYIKYIIIKVLNDGYYINIGINGEECHAMTVVGYNNPTKELIVKNSWGPENSYEKIMENGRISIDSLHENWFHGFSMIIPLNLLTEQDLDIFKERMYGHTQTDQIQLLKSHLESFVLEKKKQYEPFSSILSERKGRSSRLPKRKGRSSRLPKITIKGSFRSLHKTQKAGYKSKKNKLIF